VSVPLAVRQELAATAAEAGEDMPEVNNVVVAVAQAVVELEA